MADFTITAPTVAWYGAITGTLGLVISATVAIRDRPRLKVWASDNFVVTGGPPYDPKKHYILISVANVGRRPATVTHVYFRHRHGHPGETTVLRDSVVQGGKELKEGQSTTYLADQEAFEPDSIRAVFVSDATGREWKGKFKRNQR